MYELKIISHFAAAHQLREFEGACEKLHGHNWKIEVHVTGTRLQENGLLVDFKVIKKETEKALDQLDHQFLNDLQPFKALNPSSENIALHVFKTLSSELNTEDVKVVKVTAWESENACASYMEP
jgi:6-pyruvoyltetrahydropterin/6-carboxytetrahydropterin synthase